MQLDLLCHFRGTKASEEQEVSVKNCEEKL